MGSVDMPPFDHVPVAFSQGGGFVITHPVKKDDEGIAIFASRCIDGWHSKGGVQEEPYRRRHHQSDAMYIPGIRSQPNKLGEKDASGSRSQARAGEQKTRPASTNSIQIRTENGDWYIELTDTDVNIVCKNCTITAEEDVTVTCRNAYVTARERIDAKCQNASVTAEQRIDAKCQNASLTAEQNVDVKCMHATIESATEILLDTPVVTVTGVINAGRRYGTGGRVGTFNGSILATGEVSAAGGGVNMTTHRHTQGNDSHGDGEQPTDRGHG
jgi:hypothetical protein